MHDIDNNLTSTELELELEIESEHVQVSRADLLLQFIEKVSFS